LQWQIPVDGSHYPWTHFLPRHRLGYGYGSIFEQSSPLNPKSHIQKPDLLLHFPWLHFLFMHKSGVGTGIEQSVP